MNSNSSIKPTLVLKIVGAAIVIGLFSSITYIAINRYQTHQNNLVQLKYELSEDTQNRVDSDEKQKELQKAIDSFQREMDSAAASDKAINEAQNDNESGSVDSLAIALKHARDMQSDNIARKLIEQNHSYYGISDELYNKYESDENTFQDALTSMISQGSGIESNPILAAFTVNEQDLSDLSNHVGFAVNNRKNDFALIMSTVNNTQEKYHEKEDEANSAYIASNRESIVDSILRP